MCVRAFVCVCVCVRVCVRVCDVCLFSDISYVTCLIKILVLYGTTYFSTAEITFKQLYTNHCKDTKHKKYLNSTDLATHIWKLKKENICYNLKRTMVSKI